MINDCQEANSASTGTSTKLGLSARDYGIGGAKGLVPYEKPRFIKVTLDYDGFLCASVNSLTGTINGHETGVEIDMSGYSLSSEWDGYSND